MGAYPRGIAISPDSSTAYVAIMGGDNVVKVDLDTLTEEGSFVGRARTPGTWSWTRPGTTSTSHSTPRVTWSRWTSRDDQVVASVHTGRRLPVAGHLDRRDCSLYVVNYHSNTITKIRASDMSVLQTVSTGVNPDRHHL